MYGWIRLETDKKKKNHTPRGACARRGWVCVGYTLRFFILIHTPPSLLSFAQAMRFLSPRGYLPRFVCGRMHYRP